MQPEELIAAVQTYADEVLDRAQQLGAEISRIEERAAYE